MRLHGILRDKLPDEVNGYTMFEFPEGSMLSALENELETLGIMKPYRIAHNGTVLYLGTQKAYAATVVPRPVPLDLAVARRLSSCVTQSAARRRFGPVGCYQAVLDRAAVHAAYATSRKV